MRFLCYASSRLVDVTGQIADWVADGNSRSGLLMDDKFALEHAPQINKPSHKQPQTPETCCPGVFRLVQKYKKWIVQNTDTKWYMYNGTYIQFSY